MFHLQNFVIIVVDNTVLSDIIYSHIFDPDCHVQLQFCIYGLRDSMTLIIPSFYSSLFLLSVPSSICLSVSLSLSLYLSIVFFPC